MEKFFLILTFALTLASCGQVTQDTSVGLDNYSVVSGTFSQSDTVALTGSGVARFDAVLPAVNSSRSLSLTVEMDNTGSSIAAVFNADDISLPDAKGIILKLIRNANATVSGSISVQGTTVAIQDNRLTYLTPGLMSLVIEVHNDLVQSRVLLWRQDSVTYSLANVDVDSATASHISGIFPSGGGSGVYAGLKLNDAKVTTARMDGAKVTLP